MTAMCCVLVGFLVNLMTGCVAPLSNWHTSNEKHGKNESNEGQSVNKEMKQVDQEAKSVPVIPSPNRLRVPENISSPAIRNHQDMDTENYDGPVIVQAQVEVHPGSSTSHETLDSTKYKSFEPVFHNLEPENNNDCSKNEKTKKLPSIRKKMKYVKRIFICSRSEKSMTVNGFETDQSQRLNNPAAQSTMIKKSEQMNDKEQLSSRMEALREMVTLINSQSINGKSMCDVRINGLSKDQSDLLDLFEATESKARSVSMTTTEEEQIITIKFNRRENGNETVQTENVTEKQSLAPNRIIPPIYVSDYSINESSYKSFPKMTKNASNCPVCRGTRRKIWKAKIT